jgi:serine/threonine protein kinase
MADGVNAGVNPLRAAAISAFSVSPFQETDFRLDFEERAFLARGAYGAVFRGVCRASGGAVAIKHILSGETEETRLALIALALGAEDHGRGPADEEALRTRFIRLLDDAGAAATAETEHEARALVAARALQCDALAGLCGAYRTTHSFGVAGVASSELVIVTRLITEGTLERYAASPGATIAGVARVMRDVLIGLAALHDVEMVHRDVKPANIGLEVDSAGRLHGRLLDFGLAKPPPEVADPYGRGVGTPSFLPPAGEHPFPKTDCWAAGVTLFRVLSRGARLNSTMKKAPIKTAVEGIRNHVPPAQAAPLIALLKGLLTHDYDARLSARAAAAHEWFAIAEQTPDAPLRADHPHPLVLTRRTITCDLCGRVCAPETWFCRECVFDACPACYRGAPPAAAPSSAAANLESGLRQRRRLRHLRNLLDAASADRAARASAAGATPRPEAFSTLSRSLTVGSKVLVSEELIASLRAAFAAATGARPGAALMSPDALRRVLEGAGFIGKRFNADALFVLLDATGSGGVSLHDLFLGLSHLVATDAPPESLLFLVFAAFDGGGGTLESRACLDLLKEMGLGAKMNDNDDYGGGGGSASVVIPPTASWRSPARLDFLDADDVRRRYETVFAERAPLSFDAFKAVVLADPLLRALLIDRDDAAVQRLLRYGIPPPLDELEKEAAALAARADEIARFRSRVDAEIAAARGGAAGPHREHAGSWRDVALGVRHPGGERIAQACSTALGDGPLCWHDGAPLDASHWSCCGGRERASPCVFVGGGGAAARP